MTVAGSKSGSSADRKPRRTRVRLSPEKSNELLGLSMLALGLLLALSLVTFQPADPSVLRRVVAGSGKVANAVGPVGAQIAAVGFALFGLASFLVPLFLLVSGWRRLRGRQRDRVFGRGAGVLVVLATVPALLELLFGRVAWREGALDAGGVFGQLLAGSLDSRLHFVGALVVLLSLGVMGTALVVQSTLGDLLGAWRARGRGFWERVSLARARHRERREKEKARQRVVTKHLERVIEEKRKRSEDPPVVRVHSGLGGLGGPEGPEGGLQGAPARVDLPLRVVERRGEGEFSVRRVRASEVTAQEGAKPARPAPASPGTARAATRELPFPERPSRGSLPPLNLLHMGDDVRRVDESELVRLGEVIRSRCAEFGVEGTVEGINPGPVITVFEFQPAPGVKVSQIVNLQDDLALALKAESVRIDRLPGRSTLGIEVPNRQRELIRLGPLVSDDRFRKSPSLLTIALGKTIQGDFYYADLATMPHLLVAGATGAGKSVGLQAIITSILYKASPEEVKFIFIDPKRIELGVYADVPHLAAEVVVDPKKAANALQNMVREMERRYRLLAEVHVRSIAYYNSAIRDPEVQRRLSLNEDESELTLDDLKPLPYFVIVIDELADLMMVASSEVETAIARLAQMARAVGIHLIVATQRPSVDVLTGTIKANFPCRIAYATATRHDSRTILDQVGSEKLLGKGDMLLMPPGTSRIQRLHGAFVSEQETAALVRWLKKQGKPDYDPELLKAPESEGASGDFGEPDDDLYDEAARLVVSEGQGSASFLQRRLRVGFSRASRLIDMMERDGLLGPSQGSKPREVLVKPGYFEEIDAVREDF